MRTFVKKFSAIAAILIGLTLLEIPNACLASTYNSNTARAFLADVAKLDLSRYNVNLKEIVPSYIGNIVCEEVVYRLDSAESKIDAVCKFKDGTLVWCKLYNLEGLPITIQTSSSTLSEAKNILDRYQTFSKESYFQPLRDILSNVNDLKSMMTTKGNIKLKITVNESFETIQWIRMVNGIDNTYNRITLRFRNGTFESFWDSWNLYPTGEFNIKVMREEAINIAKGALQNYSYKVGPIKVNNFTFVDSPLSADLSMQPRENNTLYPWWDIRLYLDKVYPGRVTSFQVTLWADTGEITHITAISSGSAPAEENKPTSTAIPSWPSPTMQSNPPSSPSAQPTDAVFKPESETNSTALSLNTVAIVTITTTIATIAIIMILVKKRSK